MAMATKVLISSKVKTKNEFDPTQTLIEINVKV